MNVRLERFNYVERSPATQSELKDDKLILGS
jgi:hypothetical protein